MSHKTHLQTFLLLSVLILRATADLPTYTGQYGVGTVDVEVPVARPRNITDTVFKATGQPAFELQTVLFSLYYPIDKNSTSTKQQHYWLPRPVDVIAQGIAASSNGAISSQVILIGFQAIVGSLVIPAQVDSPLLGNNDKFPTLVFSHGDVSLSTWYSQYCGELASRGYITAAVQHRDGSAAGTVVMTKSGSTITSHNVTYFSADQLSPAINATELKMQQRSFRQAEVEETIKVLQTINDGGGSGVYQNSSRNEGQSLDGWKDRLDFSHFLVGGHSFGATLALQVLKGAPSSSIPATGSIVFDPGKDSGPLNADVNVPLLISDSEEWSSIPSEFYGQKHFDVVKSIAQGVLQRTNSSWFTTLLGTAHVSISDAPIVAGNLLGLFSSTPTNLTIDPRVSMQQYVLQSAEFFEYLKNGSRTGMLASGPAYPEFGVRNSSSKVDLTIAKEWEIHVAPASTTISEGVRNIATTLTECGSLLWLTIIVTAILC